MQPNKAQWTGDDLDGFHVTGETWPKLEPGIYYVQKSFHGPSLLPTKPKHDNIVLVNDGIAEYLYEGIQRFWMKKERYKKFGMLHKRGVLLHGAPGTGKSMAITLLSEMITKVGGCAVIWRPHYEVHWLSSALHMIRSVQPDIPILAIMEDINVHIEEADDDPEELLALLDGQSQIENVVYLATTNYVYNLPKTLTNRPSRFDEVICVGAPSKAARESYLKLIIPKDEVSTELIDELTTKSEGLMMAHLKELVVSVCVMGQSVDRVVERLQSMQGEDFSEWQKETKERTGKDVQADAFTTAPLTLGVEVAGMGMAIPTK